MTEAGDGQEAVALLATARPDVVILDLMMPKMDGFEFMEALRGRPDRQDIPVVVITAWIAQQSPGIARCAILAGAREAITNALPRVIKFSRG